MGARERGTLSDWGEIPLLFGRIGPGPRDCAEPAHVPMEPPAPARLFTRFSPLHEGDTSVPLEIGGPDAQYFQFQSPSRGGHLRAALAYDADGWLSKGFSPLHEGDTSVPVGTCEHRGSSFEFQSPSRGGHLRAWEHHANGSNGKPCFSPLHEGDTSVPLLDCAHPATKFGFQSPSRGGHLRASLITKRLPATGRVSVPFTRGTPPCRYQALEQALNLQFQSPSRGGHLRARYLWN